MVRQSVCCCFLMLVRILASLLLLGSGGSQCSLSSTQLQYKFDIMFLVPVFKHCLDVSPTLFYSTLIPL